MPWPRSAHVVRETFQTQRVEQAFLEPESTLAVPKVVDGERGLDLYSGGQGVWDDRDQVAAVLGIDNSRVWAEQVANGGAFGGKEDCANQTQTALGGLAAGPSRQDDVLPRGVAAGPPEAAPGAHRAGRGLRRRGAASPPCGPGCWATPVPTPRWG